VALLRICPVRAPRRAYVLVFLVRKHMLTWHLIAALEATAFFSGTKPNVLPPSPPPAEEAEPVSPSPPSPPLPPSPEQPASCSADQHCHRGPGQSCTYATDGTRTCEAFGDDKCLCIYNGGSVFEDLCKCEGTQPCSGPNGFPGCSTPAEEPEPVSPSPPSPEQPASCSADQHCHRGPGQSGCTYATDGTKTCEPFGDDKCLCIYNGGSVFEDLCKCEGTQPCSGPNGFPGCRV